MNYQKSKIRICFARLIKSYFNLFFEKNVIFTTLTIGLYINPPKSYRAKNVFLSKSFCVKMSIKDNNFSNCVNNSLHFAIFTDVLVDDIFKVVCILTIKKVNIKYYGIRI